MNSIPIVIFAYNRSSHFKRVMISLQNNKIKNKIYMILDGAKNRNDRIIQKDILGSVKVIGNYNKFSKNQITVIRNKKNLGLAGSINKGLDKISRIHDSFIVLEDDTIPYRKLVTFFTKCLKKYKNNNNIGAICGYQFMKFDKNPKKIETKFLKHFIPWGWATWSSTWKNYRFKKKEIKNNNLNIPPFIKKIRKNILDKKNKKKYWSLNFMLNNYINKKYFVYPNIPLVKNIGFDGSGTNSLVTDELYVFEKKIHSIKLSNFSLVKKDLLKQEKKLNKVIKNFYN